MSTSTKQKFKYLESVFSEDEKYDTEIQRIIFISCLRKFSNSPCRKEGTILHCNSLLFSLFLTQFSYALRLYLEFTFNNSYFRVRLSVICRYTVQITIFMYRLNLDVSNQNFKTLIITLTSVLPSWPLLLSCNRYIFSIYCSFSAEQSITRLLI